MVLLWLSCQLPSTVPVGMVRIPAGTFVMGRDASRHRDERPAHAVTLSAFSMDETLVTVAAFREFVEASGYVTSAEKRGSGKVSREGMADWDWEEVAGATWRTPWGPEGEFFPQEDHPAVQVSWFDAVAYCAHYGKRLPTEAEWEYAMRAGSVGTRFPWGDSPTRPDGTIGLNFWQGESHAVNDRADGHLYLSPVKAFPPNAWGVYDPVGNVWQWVSDWYGEDTYEKDAAGVINPLGPASGTVRVGRGGSWWCSATACSGYGLHARGKTKPAASFANNGFRCAKQ